MQLLRLPSEVQKPDPLVLEPSPVVEVVAKQEDVVVSTTQVVDLGLLFTRPEPHDDLVDTRPWSGLPVPGIVSSMGPPIVGWRFVSRGPRVQRTQVVWCPFRLLGDTLDPFLDGRGSERVPQ